MQFFMSELVEIVVDQIVVLSNAYILSPKSKFLIYRVLISEEIVSVQFSDFKL